MAEMYFIENVFVFYSIKFGHAISCVCNDKNNGRLTILNAQVIR